MKRPGKRWLWLIPCVMALAVGLFLLLRSRAASLSAPAPSAALLQASDGLDEIELQAEFLPESRSLRVTQRMALTSRVDDARDTLVLRTWPNAYQSMETSPLTLTELYDAAYPEGFSTGALVMEEATVAHGDGAAKKVFYRYTDTAKTVLSLPLAQSWGCGETLTVTLRYTLMLPKAASRYGVMDGVYAVGNAFPLPALYENGAYRTDDYSPIGDPFVSECANFSLELTLPDGYQCAATSFPSETRQDGERQVMTFSAPAVRDFALVLSQQFQAVQAMEGNVLVSVYAPDGNWARQALAFARAALRCYNELYGDYPYPSLTLTGSTLPYDGAEYPGLCLLSSSLTGDELEKAAAHEAAHQWWYAIVGSDSVNNAWQDEALSQFSAFSYWERAHGAAARAEWYEQEIAPSLRITLNATAGAPLSWFSSLGEYKSLVYDRGTALLCAADELLGGRMNDFLRLYRERCAFGMASRQDFLSLLTEYSGEDFTPLFEDYLDTLITP